MQTIKYKIVSCLLAWSFAFDDFDDPCGCCVRHNFYSACIPRLDVFLLHPYPSMFFNIDRLSFRYLNVSEVKNYVSYTSKHLI